MATAKKRPVSQQTTLTLSRTEVTKLLAILNKAEEFVNVTQPQQPQGFIGGLIKKIKKSAGQPIKTAT